MSDNTGNYENYVEHPRYGRSPRFTGLEPDGNPELVAMRCMVSTMARISGTGIKADTCRQKVTAFPIPFYFDQKLVCADCKRPFIWFAEEQKFCYEELGFCLGVGCHRCVHCRQRRKGRPAKATADSQISFKEAKRFKDSEKLKVTREVALESIRSISEAFTGFSGPAVFRYPESGWWFEAEGHAIARALLRLDPEDLQYDDLIRPSDDSFIPTWATTDGLLWLLPGMIRVCFESGPPAGDSLLREIFSELKRRVDVGELTLTESQQSALAQVHEAFYCTEDFDWNPKAHAHPLLD